MRRRYKARRLSGKTSLTWWRRIRLKMVEYREQNPDVYRTHW